MNERSTRWIAGSRALLLVSLIASGCQFVVGPSVLTVGGPPDGGPADGPGPDFPCVAGAVGQIGSPCASACDCQNGLCVDGYCCDEGCDSSELCKACNVPGQEGHCVLEPAGIDLRGQCATDDPSTCGHDGLCDGMGGCELYPAGTTCAAQMCANDVETYPSACDGKGTCQAGTSAACDPYVCASASACYTSCTSDAQCASGQHCLGDGTCGKRSNGQPCATGTDCASGQCAQGVCCASACNGTCYSCDLAGSVGTCAAVPAGSDPLNQCSQDPQSSCGRDGLCDGAGACRLWAAGTVCAAATCSGNSAVPARTCDGSGTCQMVAPMACGNYACNTFTKTCNTRCFSNQDCAPGKRCKNGRCM